MPVQPGTPGAGRATVVPVPAPPSTSPGWGPPAVAPPPSPSAPAALPPAPILLPPTGPLHPGPYRIQRRSLADMANEQLRRGQKPKDPLAEGMEEAGRDDCLHIARQEGSVGGLLAAPQLINRALTGRCPK